MNKKDPNWMHGKYAHIRIPKAMDWDPDYNWLMPEAKLVYGAMMDRVSLSKSKGNRFINEEGEITIIFPLTEIMRWASCRHDKATKILHQLRDAGLIELHRVGCGRPYEIVVVPMNWAERKKRNDNAEQLHPEEDKTAPGECGESARNNPDKTKPDGNPDGWAYQMIKHQIGYDVLREYHPVDLLDKVLEAMVYPFYTKEHTIPVGSAPMLTDDARHIVLSLNQEQVVYALQQLQREDVQDMTDARILRKLEHIHHQDSPGMKREEAWA